MPNRFEPKGNLVVLILILLTGTVGALFIILGPATTEKNPGVLHIGIRYEDEGNRHFARYGKSGPGARIDFIDSLENSVYQSENLRIGRNLVPIGPNELPAGPYTARLTAPGYSPIELAVQIEGRMLNPRKEAILPEYTLADYNMIGVRFQRATSNNRSE